MQLRVHCAFVCGRASILCESLHRSFLEKHLHHLARFVVGGYYRWYACDENLKNVLWLLILPRLHDAIISCVKTATGSNYLHFTREHYTSSGYQSGAGYYFRNRFITRCSKVSEGILCTSDTLWIGTYTGRYDPTSCMELHSKMSCYNLLGTRFELDWEPCFHVININAWWCLWPGDDWSWILRCL